MVNAQCPLKKPPIYCSGPRSGEPRSCSWPQNIGIICQKISFPETVLMNFPLHLALLLMGFTFTITQVMVIREFLVVFFRQRALHRHHSGHWLLLEAGEVSSSGKRVEGWGSKRGGMPFSSSSCRAFSL